MINQTAADTTDEVEEILSPEEVNEIKQKSLTGVFSYFFKTAILQGVGLASAFLLSAFFNPEDFGVYGYVTQIIGFLTFFSNIGLSASLIQKKKKPSVVDYQTAFTVQQLLSWLIVLVAFGLTQINFISQKVGVQGEWVLLALAISFPLASLKTIPSVKLERELKFSKLIIPQIFEQIMFHGVLIFLAWKGFGAIAYAYAIVARSIIGVIVMWFIRSWKVGINFNLDSFKDLVNFGAKFQLNDFLARVKDQLFFLLVGNFLPLKQFGYIQWGKAWSMYPYNLTVQNVMAITFPTFSRLQKHKDLLKKAIEKSIYFISLLIFPLLIGMSLFIQPLTIVVPRYSKWQPAIATFIMFTLSIGWASISTPLTNTLNAIGKIDRTLKLMGIWTSLTWILTPVLIWLFGFNGVALSSLLISFTSFLAIKYVKKEVPIEVWLNVKTQVFAGLGMALFGYLTLGIWSQSITWFLAGGVVVGLSYLVLVWILGRKKLLVELKSIKP